MDAESKGRTRIGRTVAVAAAALALATFGAVVAWGRQPAAAEPDTIPGVVAPTTTGPSLSPFRQPQLTPTPTPRRRFYYGGPRNYGSPQPRIVPTNPTPAPQGPGDDEEQELTSKEQLS